MTDQNKKIRYIVSIAFALIILLAFIGWIYRPTENVRIAPSSPTAYSHTWRDSTTNAVVNEHFVRILPGETKTYSLGVYTILPEKTLIYLYDPGLSIKCFENDVLIYESDSMLVFGEEVGSIWRKIPISTESSIYKITLQFTNNRSTAQKIDFDKIALGEAGDIFIAIAKNSYLAFFEGLYNFIIGIAIIILSIFLFKTGYNYFGRVILSLGITCICVAVWLYTDSAMMQLTVSNGSIRYALSYLSFMLIPVFFGHYLAGTHENYRKIFHIITYVYEIALSVLFILTFCRVIHISKGLYLTQIAGIIEIAFAVFFSIRNFAKSKSRLNTGLVIASVLMIIFALGGLRYYYSARQYGVTTYVGFGFLIFIFVVSSTELRHIIIQYRDQQRVKNYNDIASVDSVTGGNSRFASVQWMQKHDFSAHSETWMIQMFLPNFATVNALIGWDDSDKILRDIYNIIQSYLKPSDMLCRIDATFVLMLPDPANIDMLCQNIYNSVQDYLKGNYKEILLSPEFAGVWMDEYATLEQLLEKAHICYGNPHAEHHSAYHIYYFTEECNNAERKRLEVEREVTNALINEEFVVYYQPKVDPSSGKVLGAEALVRWLSPTRGMVSPGEFIPIIESTGQVADVDFYVFKKVCEYLVERRNQGLEPIRISVNISKKDIENPNFFDKYLDVIKEFDVPTDNLEFEFTESTAFGNMENIDNVIVKIHSIGSHVAMDDFGSGYSNLGVLGKLSFDVVKFDKSLFDGGFPYVTSNSTLIGGLISMFRSMGIIIVCEGIEYENACDALKELGVDLIQGFYYSRPLPEKDFTIFAQEMH